MEFFPESIIGNWAKLDNEEEEFFIFEEASISALCILGDHVEPAFEGASFRAPEVTYSLNKNEFKDEFNSFMFELNKVLKGGETMLNDQFENEKNDSFENGDENAENIKDENESNVEDSFEADQENSEEVESDFESSESEEEDTSETGENVESDENDEEDTTDEPEFDFSIEDYQALNEKFEALKIEHDNLLEKYQALESNQKEQLNAKKDEIFEKFSAILEEEVGEMQKQKDSFSVEEIDEKLSAIAFKKGLSFSLESSETNNIFSPKPSGSNQSSLPEWLKVVENKKNN